LKILVDISNLLFASYIGTFSSGKNVGIPNDSKINMCKEYVLSRINNYVTRFDVKNHEVIIAWDSKSWREEAFPLYKFKRKEGRKDETFKDMMTFFYEFKHEIIELMPWKNVSVARAEGDDIIGTLTRLFQKKDETVIILSRDKDFLQLINDDTKLLDPFSGKLKFGFTLFKDKDGKEVTWEVTDKTMARRFLLFQIISGDSTDGIPSIIQADNHFIDKGKSSRFGTKTILKTFFSDDETQNIENLKKYHHQYKEHFDRNAKLIDLNYTPKEIKEEIVSKYWEPLPLQDFDKVEKWCVENGFHSLLENLRRNK